jgi:hypothetical protein
MEDRQMMMMKNSLIRGTMGMLNDEYRMENKDGAYQYLMDVTNSTTEDDIIPLLRGKSLSELDNINLSVASLLKATFTRNYESSLTVEGYKEYGTYKGD